MQESVRGFGVTLIAVWIVLSIAGVTYSHLHDIPFHIGAPILAAFLVEAGFYLATATSATREALERWGSSARLCLLCTISAVIPYLIYSIPTGMFQPLRFLILIALAACVSAWYLVLPRNSFFDLLLLFFMAAVYMTELLKWIYPDPLAHLGVNVLGRLMWIRLGIFSVLSVRRMQGIGFGLIPSRRDWRIGFIHYLCFIPIGLGIALALGFIHPQAIRLNWKLAATAIATFIGTLWVLAVLEEFFFRGVLQQIISRKLHSDVFGIILTSLIFGAAHLNSRHVFPNWRFAILAAISGLFYGHAYLKAGSVRASMVTHACVVTTWLVFLS